MRVRFESLGIVNLFNLTIRCLIAVLLFSFFQTERVEAVSTTSINIDGNELYEGQNLISLVDGRVYVPVRYIAEHLGGQVEWDSNQRKVTFYNKQNNKQNKVELWIGVEEFKVNGILRKMDAKPHIKQNRTLVPIRFVADGLGLNVRWDAIAKRVMINQLGLHTVMANESLFLIGQAFDTTADHLIRQNNLTNEMIIPDQVLTVPKKRYSKDTVIQRTIKSTDVSAQQASNPNEKTNTDLYWLAKIIHTEARGEPFKGQIAVGAVVLNRVSTPLFPNNVYDVIFDKWGIYYQFEPVQNGEIHRLEPNETSYEAARRALAGEDPTNGALFFHNSAISQSEWMAAKSVIIRIGKHDFMN
jgi:N-acetylmuramoyl-L-alanine amidase